MKLVSILLLSLLHSIANASSTTVKEVKKETITLKELTGQIWCENYFTGLKAVDIMIIRPHMAALKAAISPVEYVSPRMKLDTCQAKLDLLKKDHPADFYVKQVVNGKETLNHLKDVKVEKTVGLYSEYRFNECSSGIVDTVTMPLWDMKFRGTHAVQILYSETPTYSDNKLCDEQMDKLVLTVK